MDIKPNNTLPQFHASLPPAFPQWGGIGSGGDMSSLTRQARQELPALSRDQRVAAPQCHQKHPFQFHSLLRVYFFKPSLKKAGRILFRHASTIMAELQAINPLAHLICSLKDASIVFHMTKYS